MALKLKKTNQYIRLLENGDVEVYSSQESRIRQKESISSTEVLLKYDELISEWDLKLRKLILSYGYTEEALTDEALHDELMAIPGVADICKKIEEIDDEEYLYSLDLSQKTGAKHEFPIMTKFFPDIKNSIPELLGKVSVRWNSASIQDIYNEAKFKKRFGETEDC